MASQTTANVFKRAASRPDTRTYISLRNLPRYALQSDIRRMLKASNVEGVQDVALHYSRFTPEGRAYLTFSSPSAVQAALNQLKRGTTLAGHPIRATPSNAPGSGIPSRVRNKDAQPTWAARKGHGARAGMTGEGRAVVIEGLPGDMKMERLKRMLADRYQLAGGVDIWQCEPRAQGQYAARKYPYSRFAVQLSSELEAHRLVRQWHMTPWDPAAQGEKYIVRARVIN